MQVAVLGSAKENVMTDAERRERLRFMDFDDDEKPCPWRGHYPPSGMVPGSRVLDAMRAEGITICGLCRDTLKVPVDTGE